MNVHALCMVCVAVYTFVHGFSTYIYFCYVYERTRTVYGMCYSVHDHTRFMGFVKIRLNGRGVGAAFFLGELTRRGAGENS